jgi:phage regulator Rha-like protein
MNEPQLFNFNGQPTLDSREVAKMIGKNHGHLMRDIHQYINDMTLNPNLDSAQFFIESNYERR